LIAVGLDPRKLTQEAYRQLHNYPDKEAVIRGIKRRMKGGLSVRPASLRRRWGKIRSDVGLLHSGIEYFCSWDNALRTAGLDPGVINQARKRKRIYATQRDVVREIRARHKRKWAINHSEIFHGTHPDGSLGIYARKYYGSWRKALKAAGFDTIKIYRQANLRHRRYPDRTSVLKAIKQRIQKGRFVNFTGVAFGYDRDLPLWYRAKIIFGSWANALKKAGLAPSKIKQDARSRAVRNHYRKNK